MACLLAQPQQNLHLNHKITITPNHQKIKVYGSSTTKELKKTYSFRHVGGAETQRCEMEQVVPHPRVVDKNQEGYLRSERSQPHIRPRSPGFQCQEDKSPQLLALKISGGWGSGRNCNSQLSPLKGPTMDFGHTQTHSLWAPALRQQLQGHHWHAERN